MARILAVDDQPHMTHVIASWLAKMGHEVVRADDGLAALRLLRTRPFDILITDVDMPGMDGLSLLGYSDAVEPLRGIIVLTGRCDYKHLVPCSCSHKTHLFPKPFSPTGLTQLVEELVSAEVPQRVADELVGDR